MKFRNSWSSKFKSAPNEIVPLKSRAERLGFEIDEESLAVDAYQQHSENNGRLRFSTVDFNGELTVVDPAAFDVVLREGIGHAKAFGCGLLLVRRL